jgi:low affinity Fe/Cu permease
MNFPDSHDRSISRASIVPFLVVFLIQYAQNLDTRALRLKLDELLRATDM